MRILAALLFVVGWGILSLSPPVARADARDAIAAELSELLQEKLEMQVRGADASTRPPALPQWQPPLPTIMQCRDESAARSECQITPKAPARVAQR